ncbi:MAG: hypothetical protein M1142_04165 [Patescibacteria group bacterium]|nr:hypothetical protein [Patescibacteria group bacterium]
MARIFDKQYDDEISEREKKFKQSIDEAVPGFARIETQSVVGLTKEQEELIARKKREDLKYELERRKPGESFSYPSYPEEERG